jgi:hypothetical protein
MTALVALVPRRPRLSRLVKMVRDRLKAPPAPSIARAAHSDALWRTYMRLAEDNADCSEALDFYPQAAAQVQTALLESGREKNAVSAEHLIEVIVRAVATPCVLSIQELGLIRARLTVAVAECRAAAARAARLPGVADLRALAPR